MKNKRKTQTKLIDKKEIKEASIKFKKIYSNEKPKG